MKYLNRIVEKKLSDYLKAFPCVLVSGARQVGKSTMVENLYSDDFKSFVFDPVQDIYGVKDDPDLFLRNNPPPLILDEIQYVPELVPALKRYIDRHRQPGMFLITGSQQWAVMKNLAESLAGRVAFIELSGFCLQESSENIENCWLNAWMEQAAEDPGKANKLLAQGNSLELSPANTIWRGSFPEVQQLQQEIIPGWMQGYVNTYLQRDVRLLTDIRNEAQFGKFLALCSSLTAQECNYRQLGRDIDLSAPTAKQWISLLQGTFQWLEVPAYSANHIKRLSEKPKGYFSDTGLASYLMRLSSPEAIQGHPAFGALFETMIVMECYRQVQQQSLVPTFYHYRQHSGAEIDLIIEKDGILYPIEIKAGTKIGKHDLRSMEIFRNKVNKKIGPGLIIYSGREILKMNEFCTAVPFDLKI